MPSALLDTNAVSDLMRDHAQVKARVGNCPDPVVTSVIVVGEIGHGLSWTEGYARWLARTQIPQDIATNTDHSLSQPPPEGFGEIRAADDRAVCVVTWSPFDPIIGSSILDARLR